MLAVATLSSLGGIQGIRDLFPTAQEPTPTPFATAVTAAPVEVVPVAEAPAPTSTPIAVAIPAEPVAPQPKEVIRFYAGQWDSLWLNNAIAMYIAEYGYGYPVEQVQGTTVNMQNALPVGKLDVNMELFKENIINWFNQETAAGNIIETGTVYARSVQGWYVPTYVIEGDPARGIEPLAPGLKSVYDLPDYWELFQDPEDPSKGLWVNCMIGWQCQKINRVKATTYGLDDYFNVVEPGSASARDAAIARAYDGGEPILFYYWEPTWVVGAYDLTLLEEPEYNPECWSSVMALVNTEPFQGRIAAKQVCGYAQGPVTSGVYAGLADRAPEVVQFLQRYFVGNQVLNELLALMELEGKTADEAAAYFFQNYPQQWSQWLPGDVAQRIRNAVGGTATSQYGGVLRLAVPLDPLASSLDPYEEPTSSQGFLNSLVFNRLLRYPSGPGADPYDLTPVPDLAESWDISPDGLEYVFNLRQGVFFHNGDELDAKDVVYTLERALVSPSATFQPLRDRVEAIAILDAYTVLIRLMEPYAGLPELLASPLLPILSNTTGPDQPIGTGPFVPVEYLPGERLTLERNPDYFRQGRPYLDKVVVFYISDQRTRVAALQAGAVDALILVEASRVAELEANPDIVVSEVTSSGYLNLAMDVRVAPFDNILVRKALQAATDRQAILDAALLGRGSIAYDHPITPYDPVFNDQCALPNYDPELAKRLLVEAGYSDGIKLTLYTSTSGAPMVEMATAFQESAAPAGINIDVQVIPEDTYWTDVWMVKPFTTVWWGARLPDAALSIVYKSDAGFNESFYNNPRVDELIIKARGEPNLEDRKQTYGEIQCILVDEVPRIVPVFRPVFMAMQGNVKGLQAHPQGWPLLDDVWLGEDTSSGPTPAPTPTPTATPRPLSVVQEGRFTDGVSWGKATVPQSQEFDFGTGQQYWSIRSTDDGTGYFYSNFASPTVAFANLTPTSPCDASYPGYNEYSSLSELTDVGALDYSTTNAMVFGTRESDCYTGLLVFRQGDLYGVIDPLFIDPLTSALTFNWWYGEPGITGFSAIAHYPTGILLGTFPTERGPRALAFDGQSMWVANSLNNSVSKFALDGTPLTSIPVGAYPSALAFDGQSI